MQPRVIERHFLDLRKKYGNVIAVDLVNKVEQDICIYVSGIMIYVWITEQVHSNKGVIQGAFLLNATSVTMYI